MSIAKHIERVRERIAAACERSGRSPEDVTLVAVSKQKSVADILEAMAAGMTQFGENRVEEARRKITEVAEQCNQPPDWHMVGHVQSRKARHVVNLDVALVHSLHDLKLATRYNQYAQTQNDVLSVLLEINISGEESKSGWYMHGWEQQPERRQKLWNDIEAMLELPAIRICGLMTMAPWVDDPSIIRPVFHSLARLREALQNDFSAIRWQHLSMGMTDDFEIAIEEGATIVRIGRAIFGERTG